MSSSHREKVFEIVSSVAEIENALAEAIKVQTKILKKDNLKSDQLENYLDTLTELIVLSIKKELVLDFLLQDVLEAWETVAKPDHKK